MSLVEKIRRARERNVDVGGFTFTVRRPTAVQWYRLAAEDARASDLLPYVIGWEGVREIDVVPGGADVPLAFDAALAAEWLADRPDLLIPLSDAIMDAYRAHVAALEGAEKN